MATIPLGSDAKMYIGGTLVNSVQNVTLNLEKGEADVTTRGAKGWKETLPTNKDASVDVALVWDTADTSFSTIATAFLKNTALECAFMDGPLATGTGLKGFFGVFKFSREEQLDGALIANATFKPTYAGSDTTKKPKWFANGQEVVIGDDED